MTKTFIGVAVALAFMGSASAQSALPSNKPATTPAPASVSPVSGTASGQATLQAVTPVQSSGQLQPSSAAVNPFTGVTKVQEQAGKALADLQAQSQISQQKLKLQRDEVDALRLEVEKRKVIEQLSPPAPVKAPQASTPVKRSTKKDPKPVLVITPSEARNERPEVVGVIESGGQQVALIQHDGRSLRAQVGSTIAGKTVTQISPEGIQWGGEYLSRSSRRGMVQVEVTDTEASRNKKQGGAQQAMPPVSPAASTQSFAQAYPKAPLINPQGSTSNSTGSTNPSGIFGTLPPPPPNISQH